MYIRIYYTHENRRVVYYYIFKVYNVYFALTVVCALRFHVFVADVVYVVLTHVRRISLLWYLQVEQNKKM